MGGCGSSEEKDLSAQYAGEGVPLAWFKRDASGTKEADCFYLHPTTELGMTSWNVSFNGYSKGKVLTGTAAGVPDLWETQAECMTGTCNVWAPRYSQMGMLAMAAPAPGKDSKFAKFKASVDRAYNDAAAAFNTFLAERPDKSRPFFILAHSQGSILMVKVIKEILSGHEQQKAFVAAYLAGGYVPIALVEGIGNGIHVCNGPEDTNCIISYDTRMLDVWTPGHLNEGMLALWPTIMYRWMFNKEGEENLKPDPEAPPRVQINPTTWTHSEGVGDGPGYLGAKQYGVADAQLPKDAAGFGAKIKSDSHCLWIEDPRPFLVKNDAGPAAKEGNLHPVDVSFWFNNIQENVPKRLAAFKGAAPAAEALGDEAEAAPAEPAEPVSDE